MVKTFLSGGLWKSYWNAEGSRMAHFVGMVFLGARYVEVYPSSCLERGVTYQIRLDFNRYRSDRLSPDASILIDSVCTLGYLYTYCKCHRFAYRLKMGSMQSYNAVYT